MKRETRVYLFEDHIAFKTGNMGLSA